MSNAWQLEILGSPTLVINDPTEADVANAIAETYQGLNEGLNLDGDQNHPWMGMPSVSRKGGSICCKAGPGGPELSVDDVPEVVAQFLFRSYLRGDGAWRTTLRWEVE